MSWAEVAQLGQRRRPEAPVPKGFVGSNPTLRTFPQTLRTFKGHFRFLNTLASPISQTYSKPTSTSLRASSVIFAALLMYSSLPCW